MKHEFIITDVGGARHQVRTASSVNSVVILIVILVRFYYSELLGPHFSMMVRLATS